MYIKADWPAPASVVAGVTTRQGGVSKAPFDTNNMALHVGDEQRDVLENRRQLDAALPDQKIWHWLDQVHGTHVVKTPFKEAMQADACISQIPGQVCTIMTADCLPIVLCTRKGNEVAAIHAGWRSLAAGIIANTLADMSTASSELIAWLGPAIGPGHFEVGQDVYEAFAKRLDISVINNSFTTGEKGKYFADLYQLATWELEQAGVAVYKNHQYCTVDNEELFYSYRRDGVTGRMATFIYFLS